MYKVTLTFSQAVRLYELCDIKEDRTKPIFDLATDFLKTKYSAILLTHRPDSHPTVWFDNEKAMNWFILNL